MQYTLVDLLRTEHMLVGMAANDAAEAIRKMTDAFVQTGHASVEFAEDTCKREVTFPTGLPTEPVPVAIPHADPDHVNASAVAIASLRSTVKFAQMGTDGSVMLDVPLIFLLAIKEREKQVEMIQQLMEIIQNPTLLVAITKAGTPAEILKLIRDSLKI